jgi:cytoskeletal protein CcmA (bactofilin family)
MAEGSAPARSEQGTPVQELISHPFMLSGEIDIVGSVYIDAPVVLEGRVDGELRCPEVEIARSGWLRGLIVAERVTVYGTVTEGRIYANVLMLKPGCNVEAEIYHEHLQLDQGSYFDGKSRRLNDPTSLAPA